VLGPLLTPIPGIQLSFWQVLLIALVPVCLASRGAFEHRSRELDRAIVFSILCVAIVFLWGYAHGGSPYYAYYQVWRFLTALLVAYLLMSVLRSPQDLKRLGTVVVVAALIRATLCIYFYWNFVRGRSLQLEYLTTHDDALLFVAAILIVGCWALIKGRWSTWLRALGISLYIFYAIFLNDRRIAWVELALAIVAIYFMLGRSPLKSKVNRWLVATAPLLLVYVVVGWGRDGAIFAPIEALSSAGSNYDPSSLTRQEEVRNLLYTLTELGNPLFGTGWGIPYVKVESFWSNYSGDWVLNSYTPHNSLLGLAVFAGLVGVLGIWGVVPLSAWLAARAHRNSNDTISRAAALVAAAILVAYSVHCYGDIGFQSLTCNLLFGAAIAAAGKMAAWSAMAPEAQPAKLAKGSYSETRRLPISRLHRTTASGSHPTTEQRRACAHPSVTDTTSTGQTTHNVWHSPAP